MLRREPCICGGVISAPANDWEAIAHAVRRHNASARHATPDDVAKARAAQRRAERALLRTQVELVRLRRAVA